jgi:hypothetical protein
VSYLEDRSARLYYDSSCGPCRLLARAAEGMSHHRLNAIPLESPGAAADLSDLSTEDRFGSAHLVTGSTRLTGADLATPLVRFALGARLARVVASAPPLDRSLRWVYVRFWNYRRTRGCAAATFR